MSGTVQFLPRDTVSYNVIFQNPVLISSSYFIARFIIVNLISSFSFSLQLPNINLQSLNTSSTDNNQTAIVFEFSKLNSIESTECVQYYFLVIFKMSITSSSMLQILDSVEFN